MQARIERFGVDAAIDRRPRGERGSDRLAVEAAGVESGQIEQRGGDVDEAERAGDAPPAPPAPPGSRRIHGTWSASRYSRIPCSVSP